MKNRKTEIKWALIFAVMTLCWMLMERLVGLHDKYIAYHLVLTNLIAVPAITTYVYALLDKRKRDYNGVMSYKEGFVSGLIITVVVTLLSPLTQLITSLVITPHYFTNVINYVVENGSMTREEAQDFFNLKNYILQGLAGAFGMGTLTSAIVALFVRSAK